jgi:hypothetical protein
MSSRYIIDFYEGRGAAMTGLPTCYLDVRPAPSVGGYFDWARLKFEKMIK